MNDMRKVTEPKSDQWNFDDFQAGPLTFTIEAVSVKGGQEQPVEITLAGTPKFYRPCKSMSRCLVAAWGPDSSKYVGRSLTLYGDPKVRWGGLEVGGIRISHMSHIESAMTMALTVTRANKKPFTVRPIVDGQSKAAATTNLPEHAAGSPAQGNKPSSAAPSYISPNEVAELEQHCTSNGIPVANLLKAAKVERLAMIETKDVARATAWINAAIDARRQKAKETT